MSAVHKVASLAIKAGAHKRHDTDYDVLIAGAGMSGLYSAWRLLSDGMQSPELAALAAARPDGKLKIGIIEYSDRVGGRLDSVILDNMVNVPAELGGMRFTESHALLNLVIDTLKLRPLIDKFPMTENSQFLLRGERLSETRIRDGEKVPYKLEEAELKQTPNELFNYAITQIVGEGALKWSDGNWQWIKENFIYSDAIYDNQHLYNIGFWNILFQTLSNEGFDFCWDGGGYNSNTINWNAAEAMPYMLTDFSVTPSYLRFKTGFHTLPADLFAQVQTLGGSVRGNTRLVRFDKRADGRVTALIEPTDKSGPRHTLTAHNLILAMPRHSLELLDQDTDFFNSAEVQYNIQSVLLQPAYKLFMAYENRWWSKPEFYPGPTITDMQLRMTYDFGTEAERGGAPTDQRALLLASYCDMQADSFWSVLERDKIYDEPPSWSQIGAKGGAVAPATMCRMAESMTVQSLSVVGLPPPTPSKLLAAYYQDWSQDPYGAGFHAWAAHYKAWEIMRSVRKPLPLWPVYICGEAYSNAQGWVEGALCTAESVLEDFFGLPRIAGLPCTYPLLSSPPVKPGDTETHPTFVLRSTPNAF